MALLLAQQANPGYPNLVSHVLAEPVTACVALYASMTGCQWSGAWEYAFPAALQPTASTAITLAWQRPGCVADNAVTLVAWEYARVVAAAAEKQC